jgi:hypothetical protein
MTVAKFKTEPRYIGPYEVVEQTPRGNYILKELDGTEHAEKYAAFRIIPYIKHTDPLFQELLNDTDDNHNDTYDDHDNTHDKDENSHDNIHDIHDTDNEDEDIDIAFTDNLDTDTDS